MPQLVLEPIWVQIPWLHFTKYKVSCIVQLLLSKDVGYLKKEVFTKIAEQTVLVDKLITGLIKSMKSRN